MNDQVVPSDTIYCHDIPDGGFWRVVIATGAKTVAEYASEEKVIPPTHA
jgi:hypothetical protein